MSYDDMPHYERETFLKNHLEALLKAVIGILFGRNAPSYWLIHHFGEKLISTWETKIDR
jgi:hypothetical protein